MTSLLLNIGHDIAGILIDMIAYVNKVRASNRVLKIVLWPISYGLLVAKVVIMYLANGSRQFYNHSIPWGITSTRNHIYSATPASIFCFNKTRLFIFVLEAYFFCFFHVWVSDRRWRLIPYLTTKVIVTVVPFVALTPTQRLPFWFIAIVLTFFEIWMGLFLILSMGYGINFLQDNFYNHWAKHYRYRAPTSNRVIFVELCCHVFVITKVFTLNDGWCSWVQRFKIPLRPPIPERRNLVEKRLANPHTPTKGDVSVVDFLLSSELLFAICGLAIAAYIIVLYYATVQAKKPMLQSNTNKKQTLLQTRFFAILATPLRNSVSPYPFLALFVLSALSFFSQLTTWSATLHNCVRPVRNYSFSVEHFAQAFPQKAACALSLDFDFINALVEQDTVANLRYGVLFLLALSSLGVYSIILAGWSSNSKYAFIGALRSAAQMISYEVAISLIILPVVLFSGSLNLSMITYVQHITTWLLWPLLPVALLFLVAMLAETNRTPFDLPEAEAELVAGYNVDYSSLPFAMFFLGEYCNMILISTLYCLLFLAGGLNSLGLTSAVVLSAKAAVTWVFFVLVRATLPRYRYDQLMDIGWKVFLPVSGSFLLFVFGILVFYNALPVTNELPLNMRVPELSSIA